jgi:hypothetical protein
MLRDSSPALMLDQQLQECVFSLRALEAVSKVFYRQIIRILSIFILNFDLPIPPLKVTNERRDSTGDVYR